LEKRHRYFVSLIEASGGFRENIGVEVRLAKFFFPPPRPN